MSRHPLLPVGGHTSYECSWSRSGDVLTLWCPLHVGLDDLGTFEVQAGPSTRFVVNGIECDMEAALGSYGELSGETVLVAHEPGELALMVFNTRAGN